MRLPKSDARPSVRIRSHRACSARKARLVSTAAAFSGGTPRSCSAASRQSTARFRRSSASSTVGKCWKRSTGGRKYQLPCSVPPRLNSERLSANGSRPSSRTNWPRAKPRRSSCGSVKAKKPAGQARTADRRCLRRRMGACGAWAQSGRGRCGTAPDESRCARAAPRVADSAPCLDRSACHPPRAPAVAAPPAADLRAAPGGRAERPHDGHQRAWDPCRRRTAGAALRTVGRDAERRAPRGQVSGLRASARARRR